MTAVDNTNLNSAPLQAVVDILTNSTYINDPRRAQGRRNRKFIYRSDPDNTSYDFSLYPLIYVTTKSKLPSKQGADQTTREINWVFSIVIRTAKRGSGRNRDDQGVDDMMNIMDSVDQYFESNAIRTDFKNVKLNYRQIQAIRIMDEIAYNNDMILETEYELLVRSRMVVRV